MKTLFVLSASALALPLGVAAADAGQAQYDRCVNNCRKNTRGSGLNNCVSTYCTHWLYSGGKGKTK